MAGDPAGVNPLSWRTVNGLLKASTEEKRDYTCGGFWLVFARQVIVETPQVCLKSANL
jgi:hypothetical protein